jgi:PAS domain S-box-containing protein
LRESRNRPLLSDDSIFQTLLEAAPDAMVIVDQHGQIILCNAQTEKLFGYAREELLGRSVEILLPESAREKHVSHRNAYASAPRTRPMGVGMELSGRRKDGSEFPVEISLSPLKTPEGILVTSAIRDVTDRKKAELKFRALLEAAPDAMVIADQHGKIVLANAQTEKLFGYPRHELLGQTVEMLMPEAARAKHVTHRGSYNRAPWTRPIHSGLELFGRRKDGTIFPAEISLSPLQTSDVVFVTASIRDITDRKNEEALRARHESELTQAHAELEAAYKELESFSYSVSHDLRAPLRHIDGFSRILAEEYKARLDSEGQHYLQRIMDGAQQMGRLVDNLLDLSRVGRQEVEFRPVDLNGVIEGVRTGLGEEASKREIEWRIAPMPAVECDAGLVKLVFINLMSNAVKFSATRKRAVIEVGWTEQDGERVFYVRDNGVGFDLKYADKLFGVFQRLHRQEEFEGTGVGLATVQRIIHKHGGRIWANSAPGQGATFYFTLEKTLRISHESGVEKGLEA